MPHWALTLVNPDGRETSTFNQAAASQTVYAVWIEGKPSEPHSWHFTTTSDETQVKSDLICQFNFKAGGLRVSTELSDTYIKPPPDPTCRIDCRVWLDYSCQTAINFAVLRNGDTIEFSDQNIGVRVALYPDASKPEADPKVEVTSSRPLVIDIKEEPSSDAETDDEADLDGPRSQASVDESQQRIYSTGRENQSPNQKTAADSQVIKETPSRKRVRSQHESTVFDSINMLSFNNQAHPSAITQPELDLPGTSHNVPVPADLDALNELPDTLQDSYPPDLYSEPVISGDGNPSTNEVVDQVVRNLNESATPPSGSAVPEGPLAGFVARPTSSVSNKEAGSPAEEPPTESPDVLPASVEDKYSKDVCLEDSNSGDENHDNPDTIGVSDGTPNSSSNFKRPSNATPASRSTGKRRRLRDVALARTTKRVRLNDEDSDHDDETTAVTPASTASRRSSSRTRTSRSASHDPSGCYSGPPPKILFSNTEVPQRSGLMRFLKSRKATMTESTTPKGSNFLCVGRGELKTTAKLLHSLTQNKTIVTEDWVVQSSKQKVLLNPADFLPGALEGTMSQNRNEIFSGQVIYITPKLRQDYGKGFDDIQAIIRQAGGTNPLTGPPDKLKNREDITIYIGAEADDPIATELHNSNVVLFKKELIGASIVHGGLLVENEDLILSPNPITPVENEKPEKSKKGRRKK